MKNICFFVIKYILTNFQCDSLIGCRPDLVDAIHLNQIIVKPTLSFYIWTSTPVVIK